MRLNSKRACFILILLLLLVRAATAQNPYVEHYNTSNGLPSNTVYRVFQDSRKFIWMATDAGVARFDGSRFKLFTTKDGLNTSEIIHIQEDSRGRIWIFNFNGTYNFYYNDKFFNGENAPFLDSLQSPYVFRKMFEDEDKNLYFHDNFYRDVYILNKANSVKKSKTAEWFSGGYDIANRPIFFNSIRYLKAAKNEYKYFAAGGIYKVKNLHDLPTPLDESNEIERVFSNNNEVLFADVIQKKTRERLLLKYNLFQLSDTIYTPFRQKDELINDAFVDNDGNCWVSTNSGLYCVKGKNVKYQLKGTIFQNIASDHEGNIWVGSIAGGVFKVSPLLLKHYHLGTELFNSKGILAGCIRDQGGIWAVDGERLYLIRDKKIFKSDFYIKNANIAQIEELQNRTLLLGQLNYNLRALTNTFNKNGQIISKLVLPQENKFKKFSVNASKNEFAAFYPTFLYRFTQNDLFKNPEIYIYTADRLFSIYHNASDQLFVNGKRIYRFNEGKLIPFKPLSLFDGKIIRQHLNLKDRVELFNIGGDSLFLFDGKRVKTLSGAFNLMVDRQIVHMAYQHPYLFIATNAQIYYCINPERAISGKSITLYNFNISFKNIHQLLLYNNELVVSSDDGMSFIPLQSLTIYKPEPPIPYFRNIIINDHSVSLLNLSRELRGKNKLQFILGNIRYNSSKVQYAYRLDGLDKDWNIGTEQNINYQNLRPGKYKFRFKVKLSSTGWSPELSYILNVRPTLFQHPLFYVFGGILGVLLLYFAILRDQKSILAKKETEHQLLVLEQKALHSMMNPHFIFNVLGSIQSYMLKSKPADAGLYLSQFARLIRQNLNATKKSMIEMEEEIEQLRTYMELEQLRLNNRFTFKIIMDDSIDDEVMIPTMMLQPIVENAIWHGLSELESDGRIMISFTPAGEKTMKVVIEDNGIGIQQAGKKIVQKESHLKIGMELTRKRLEILGKKMKVRTSITTSDAFPGDDRPGTRVEIIMPTSMDANARF